MFPFLPAGVTVSILIGCQGCIFLSTYCEHKSPNKRKEKMKQRSKTMLVKITKKLLVYIIQSNSSHVPGILLASSGYDFAGAKGVTCF